MKNLKEEKTNFFEKLSFAHFFGFLSIVFIFLLILTILNYNQNPAINLSFDQSYQEGDNIKYDLESSLDFVVGTDQNLEDFLPFTNNFFSISYIYDTDLFLVIINPSEPQGMNIFKRWLIKFSQNTPALEDRIKIIDFYGKSGSPAFDF